MIHVQILLEKDCLDLGHCTMKAIVGIWLYQSTKIVIEVSRNLPEICGMYGKSHDAGKTFCIKIHIWTFSNETLNEMLVD